jgi:hypothetical protein
VFALIGGLLWFDVSIPGWCLRISIVDLLVLLLSPSVRQGLCAREDFVVWVWRRFFIHHRKALAGVVHHWGLIGVLSRTMSLLSLPGRLRGARPPGNRLVGFGTFTMVALLRTDRLNRIRNNHCDHCNFKWCSINQPYQSSSDVMSQGYWLHWIFQYPPSTKQIFCIDLLRFLRFSFRGRECLLHPTLCVGVEIRVRGVNWSNICNVSNGTLNHIRNHHCKCNKLWSINQSWQSSSQEVFLR